MKTLTRSQNESKIEEGIFLVNPRWIHLDEDEIKDGLNKGDKLFKVSTSFQNK